MPLQKTDGPAPQEPLVQVTHQHGERAIVGYDGIAPHFPEQDFDLRTAFSRSQTKMRSEQIKRLPLMAQPDMERPAWFSQVLADVDPA